MVKLYTIEKQYTVKANGTTAEGKKLWQVFDKVNETFLPQFEGGRFTLQRVAHDLNEGIIKIEEPAEEVTKVAEESTEATEHTEHTEPTTAPRLIAYMRISTNKEEQKFDRQEAQLKDVGCTEFYADRISGAKRERPELDAMLDSLQAGDTVYLLSIDRLSRSTKDLLEIVETIKSKGAYLKSINDSWLDTTSDNPMSDFLLTVMGALGQMERAMITKRVQEGVDVAKRKGVKLGRPTANKNKVAYALELYDAGCHTINQIVDITGISRATLFRKVKAREEADLNG